MRRLSLITGAAQGLGQAIAVELAKQGSDIVIVDVGDAQETVDLVQATGRRVTSLQCDISDRAAVERLLPQLDDIGAIDVLVNNAGIYPFVMFEDLSYEQWRQIQSTNLDSTFLMCKLLLPGMKTRRFGRIVNIASNSYMNGADPMLAGYVSSKGGIIGLSRALGSEYGEYGITVNVVAPGLLVTQSTIKAIGEAPGDSDESKWGQMRRLQSIKRSGTPEDVVGAVSFFVSEAASYITAQTLIVDGGLARI
jgi:NAD(P)-dependent dehydrogenase (short-subunit alcohol dehydrogenase family)